MSWGCRFLLGVGVVLGVGIAISIYRQEKWWRWGDDLRIGLVDRGVELVTFSPARRMVNRLKIPEDFEIWVPGGPGWYRTDRLLKLLEQENEVDKVAGVLFYNFGFIPQRVILNTGIGMKELGWWSWFKWQIMSGQMLDNEEEVSGQPAEVESIFEELMTRDFADNRTLNDGVRAAIFNTGEIPGLASFVARRLEWAGVGVVSVNNSEVEVDSCLIRKNPKIFSPTIDKAGRFLNCERVLTDDLDENRVELYLGQGLAVMIKYDSYMRF